MRRLLPPSTQASLPVPQAPEQRRFGILAVAVVPQYRRLGLGARVMEEAEKIARELGFAAMSLTVQPGNEPAVRFYERLGWAAVADGGVWGGRMEKILAKT